VPSLQAGRQRFQIEVTLKANEVQRRRFEGREMSSGSSDGSAPSLKPNMRRQWEYGGATLDHGTNISKLSIMENVRRLKLKMIRDIGISTGIHRKTRAHALMSAPSLNAKARLL